MSARRPLLERYAPGGEPGQYAIAAAPPPPKPAPPPEPNPEALAVEAAAAAREAQAAQAAALLARIEAEAQSACRAAAQATAERLTKAATLALPHLTTAGFAAEIAALWQDLATSQGQIQITLAPDDAEIMAALLTGQTDPLPITADPALSPGQARLTWADGGADLDRERLIADSLAALAPHLPTSQEPTP
ncbi:MAG: FliH/SctL family protein [Pseudomonadota bacterium]